LWYSRARERAYDCAGLGAREYDPARDTTRITYAGRAYYCHASANAEWIIEPLASAIPEDRFELRIDGHRVASTKLVAFASRVAGTQRFPQVLAIYSSGYLRLKSGDDPVPPLPFGQSLVLGPAVFGTSTSFPDRPRLFFNPQIQRVDVDRSRLTRSGRGSLLIRITASDRGLAPTRTETNQIMNLTWELVLHEPTTARTRLDVAGSFAFTEQFTPDPDRTARLESLRLVQISSMYIDPRRHDVDAFRYRDQNGQVEVAFSPRQANSLLPPAPSALAPASPVLDVVHSDDVGQPNGDTPSYRITLRSAQGPLSGPFTPRAYFNSTQDLNHDNLGVWLYQQPSSVIEPGATGTIAYTVVATADPQPRP
jgi:hypothetical protein